MASIDELARIAATGPSPATTPGGIGALAARPAPVPAEQLRMYTPESVPKLGAPRIAASVPAVQAPTPEAAPRLGAQQQASGPLARASGLAGAVAKGLGIGAVAHTALSAIDPEDKAGAWIDKNVPGAAWLDNQASRIGMGRSYAEQGAQQPTIAGVGRGAPGISAPAATAPQTGGAPGTKPALPETPHAPAATISAVAPGYGAEMRRLQGQASPAPEITTARSPNGPLSVPMAQNNADAPDGGQIAALAAAQNPIAFTTYGGGQGGNGTSGALATYKDGTQAPLNAVNPADLQQFNQINAQAAQQQAPVHVIRGMEQSVALPGGAYMREVPQSVFDGGPAAINGYQAAQQQRQINATDPLAAETAAKIAVEKEKNAGHLAAVTVTADGHARTAGMQRDAGKVPPGYRMSQDGGRMEAVPGGPADIGKALPNPAVKSLSAAGASVENTQRLAGSFKEGFGNHTILGDKSNTFKRIFGDETKQAQWWQDMDSQQNQTRHDLFGSALTATELAAWEKTSITPRMDSKQITENLARRSEIEARAASALARSYSVAGYNKAQINELLGTAAEYINKAAPPVGKADAKTAAKPAAATKTFDYNGQDTAAKLAPNGKYYIQKPDGKYTEVDEGSKGFADGGIIPGNDIAEQFAYQDRQTGEQTDAYREQASAQVQQAQDAVQGEIANNAASSYATNRENEAIALDSMGYDVQELGYANGGLIGGADTGEYRIPAAVVKSLGTKYFDNLLKQNQEGQ